MFLPTLISDRLTTAGFDEHRAAARLRLVGCRLERGPAAMSRVIVEFDHAGDATRIVSQQEGSACPGGDLRLAALATLTALSRATAGTLTFELIGAKPIRAFDATLMVVAAFAHHEGEVTRIFGAALVEDDQLIATARAALHAANRLASPFLSPSDIVA